MDARPEPARKQKQASPAAGSSPPRAETAISLANGKGVHGADPSSLLRAKSIPEPASKSGVLVSRHGFVPMFGVNPAPALPRSPSFRTRAASNIRLVQTQPSPASHLPSDRRK